MVPTATGLAYVTLPYGKRPDSCSSTITGLWPCSVVHGPDVDQCQLVKNLENWANSLNIGIKFHSGMNLETNGMDNAVCRAMFLFS